MLLLTKPADLDDVLVMVDGHSVGEADIPLARAFLGDWKVEAKHVQHANVPIFVSSDALLLELPSNDRDDAGRREPVAVWTRTPIELSDVVQAVQSFAEQASRSLDVNDVKSAYFTAVQGQHSTSPTSLQLLKAQASSFFVRVFRRMAASVRRTLGRRSRPEQR